MKSVVPIVGMLVIMQLGEVFATLTHCGGHKKKLLRGGVQIDKIHDQRG